MFATERLQNMRAVINETSVRPDNEGAIRQLLAIIDSHLEANAALESYAQALDAMLEVLQARGLYTRKQGALDEEEGK